jgi:hypothetical protein
MKKNKKEPTTIRFTQEQIAWMKSMGKQHLDGLLAEQYTVKLPLFTIKFLLQKLVSAVMVFDIHLEEGMAINSREGGEADAWARSIAIIQAELIGLGLNGKQIVDEIVDEEKRFLGIADGIKN